MAPNERRPQRAAPFVAAPLGPRLLVPPVVRQVAEGKVLNRQIVGRGAPDHGHFGEQVRVLHTHQRFEDGQRATSSRR